MAKDDTGARAAGTLLSKIIDLAVEVVCIWVLFLPNVPSTLHILAWFASVSMGLLMLLQMVLGNIALTEKNRAGKVGA